MAKMYKIILPVIGLVLTAVLILKLYPGLIVNIYGEKSHDGALVYINEKKMGIMKWDEENKRSYAKDLRIIGPSPYLISKKLPQDSLRLRMNERKSNVDIKIITVDGKVYQKSYRNIEDIAYFIHYLKDFEVRANADNNN